MKFLILFTSYICLSASFAAPVIGGKTAFKKMEINCNFLDDENRFLDAAGYSLSASGGITFAEVVVYNQVGSRKSILEHYHLNYIKPNGLSLIFKFEDKRKKIHLEVFGDDMGGMSSLSINGQTSDLTCTVEN